MEDFNCKSQGFGKGRLELQSLKVTTLGHKNCMRSPASLPSVLRAMRTRCSGITIAEHLNLVSGAMPQIEMRFEQKQLLHVAVAVNDANDHS